MKKIRKKNKYIYLFISIIFIVFLFYNLNNINKPYDFLKKLTAFVNIENDNSNEELINSEINELNKEIEELKQLSDINNLLTDKTVINASIIKRSPNYWYNYITINKGSKNGIKKGNAVISNKGLIGVVAIANDYTSEVRLISIIKDNYISVKFNYNDKEYYGLIKDYNIKNNEIIIEDVIGDIPDIKDISVVTSGLSSNIPSGLLIGKIKYIKKDSFNLSNILIVEPSADLNNINIVRVITND